MSDESAVLDRGLNPIFSGSSEEVLEWLKDHCNEGTEAVWVRVGMTKRIVAVAVYMHDMEKERRKVPQPKRKTRKQIVLELLQELLSIDTERSGESLDDLAEEYADKIVRLYS